MNQEREFDDHAVLILSSAFDTHSVRVPYIFRVWERRRHIVQTRSEILRMKARLLTSIMYVKAQPNETGQELKEQLV